jgi:hypothetical protein
MGGIFKHAVEMGPGATVYIASFINIGSGNQKLIGRDTQTHREEDNHIRQFLFFQNKQSWLQNRNEVHNKIKIYRTLICTTMMRGSCDLPPWLQRFIN